MANLTKTISNRIGVAKDFLDSGWDIASWDSGLWDDPPATSDIPGLDLAIYKLISNSIDVDGGAFIMRQTVHVFNAMSASAAIYKSLSKVISNTIGVSTAIDRRATYRRTFANAITLTPSDIKANYVNGIWILVLPDSATNVIDRFTPVYTSMTVSATVWSEI